MSARRAGAAIAIVLGCAAAVAHAEEAAPATAPVPPAGGASSVSSASAPTPTDAAAPASSAVGSTLAILGPVLTMPAEATSPEGLRRVRPTDAVASRAREIDLLL